MASLEQWTAAWNVAYDALPSETKGACPNCGHRTLRLVFSAKPASAIGYAEFWCDTCLEGLDVSRVVVPEGAVVRDTSLPEEERRPQIPDYRPVN
jgi:hypothetical protein